MKTPLIFEGVHIEPTLSKMQYSQREREFSERSLSDDLSPRFYREKPLGSFTFQEESFPGKEIYRLPFPPAESL